MALLERVYSVLLVSASEKFNTVFSPLLPEARYSPVNSVKSAAEASQALLSRDYDLVIINSPLTDDAGLLLASDTAAKASTIVLLFVKSDVYDNLFTRTSAQGVYMLPKPTSAAMIRQALDWMITARERLRRMEKKTVSLSEKMEEIRVVNRAKWVLISERNWSEDEAHRFIEKQAMDRCVTRRKIAEDIIAQKK